MGSLSTLGFALGSAWLSGINLYATILTLGLLQRFGLADLPGDLKLLSQTWVLVVAGALYAIEVEHRFAWLQFSERGWIAAAKRGENGVFRHSALLRFVVKIGRDGVA
jgi:hypothetical protein